MTTRAAADVRLATALIFITPALWSVNYLVARWAPGVIAPHMLALGRWGVAALLLGTFCWRELLAKRHLVSAEAGRFVALGALGMWICGAFVYIGGRSTLAVDVRGHLPQMRRVEQLLRIDLHIGRVGDMAIAHAKGLLGGFDA